jgi:hypothetical protein
MINPSANGWIDKYFYEQKKVVDYSTIDSLSFYKNIRQTGFIFGHIVTITHFSDETITNWKTEEISKVALLSNLFEMYCFTSESANSDDFIIKALAFYNEMIPKGFGFLTKIISSSSSSKLEHLIDERVQTNKDIISKNFSHIVTNALLFVDVLAFRHYILQGKIPDKYLKRIEETIMSLVSLALQVKTVKSTHDDLLIKLFEASVRYSKFLKISNLSMDTLALDDFSDVIEKYYLLDLTGLTLWNDNVIEKEELYFLYTLAEKVGVSDVFVTESVATTHEFITTHKNDIPYFNYSNPAKHFYDQTTESVVFLINRNRKRLIKEISQSKELMQLLAKSANKDLSKEEKKKVKKQLLDICKTIPSLTIFLIPGGSLLLPILIKFIPQLLPSSFNENLED